VEELSRAPPTLAALVRERTGATWSRARALCAEGRVTVNGERWLDPAARVPARAEVVIDEQGPKVSRGALAPDSILHVDRDVVVVDKPAGLLSVADEPGTRDTLAEYLRTLLRRRGEGDGKLGVVHRLDRETSGVMVFARTPAAQRALAAAFRAHDIDRVYVGLAHGEVTERRIESWLLADRGDGIRGSFGTYRHARGEPPPEARQSITFVKPLVSLRGGTLVECRLETGRQHQIRIHLAEAGNPLLGEKVYVRDYAGPTIDAPRVMLHARRLGFAHPAHGKPITFEREPPEDFALVLARLEQRG
jgi:23S rRNA pseudouridine1911/1915/1917 synthase